MMSDECGMMSYPAAMGFHDRTSVALGALFIGPRFGVDTATGSHDGIGADWITAPLFQAVLRAHDQWRIGLGISAPFGLDWKSSAWSQRWSTG